MAGTVPSASVGTAMTVLEVEQEFRAFVAQGCRPTHPLLAQSVDGEEFRSGSAVL